MYSSQLTKVMCRFLAIFLGTCLIVMNFAVSNVGDDDVICLQSTISSVSVLSVYEPVSIPVVYNPEDETNDSHMDLKNIEKNTFLISADDIDEQYEAIDPEAFTYDGISMWISVNIANVRSEPSIDGEIIEQLDYSTKVLRISYGNSWSLIRLDDEDSTEGYIISSSLSEDEIVAPTPTPTLAPSPTATPTPVVVTPSTNTSSQEAPTVNYTVSSVSLVVYASCALNVRSGPSINSSLIRVLSYGDEINVIGQTDNGWYQISDGNFVKCDLCTSTQPQIVTNNEVSATGNSFSDYCLQFVGTNYVYGGGSPSGFDCSGLVRYVYANYYGISLPHNAAEIAIMGTPVSGDVQVGDVLCHDYNGDGYIEHVSIFIGNGMCIHASNSRSGVITSAWPMGSVVTIRRFI